MPSQKGGFGNLEISKPASDEGAWGGGAALRAMAARANEIRGWGAPIGIGVQGKPSWTSNPPNSVQLFSLIGLSADPWKGELGQPASMKGSFLRNRGLDLTTHQKEMMAGPGAGARFRFRHSRGSPGNADRRGVGETC